MILLKPFSKKEGKKQNGFNGVEFTFLVAAHASID
jgi:hypothetical protein